MTQDALRCKACKRHTDKPVCPRCYQRDEQKLAQLHDLWVDAHAELLPATGGQGSSSSEPSLGINIAALDFISGADILGILHSWEATIRQERGLTPPALVPPAGGIEREVTQAITFQLIHLPHTANADWFYDWHQEINILHKQGMTAARKYIHKAMRIPCPAHTHEGLPCKAKLNIPNDITQTIVCHKCRTDWSPMRLVRYELDKQECVWLDAEAIAVFMGYSRDHINRIAKKHNVQRRGQLINMTQLLSRVSA